MAAKTPKTYWCLQRNMLVTAKQLCDWAVGTLRPLRCVTCQYAIEPKDMEDDTTREQSNPEDPGSSQD